LIPEAIDSTTIDSTSGPDALKTGLESLKIQGRSTSTDEVKRPAAVPIPTSTAETVPKATDMPIASPLTAVPLMDIEPLTSLPTITASPSTTLKAPAKAKAKWKPRRRGKAKPQKRTTTTTTTTTTDPNIANVPWPPEDEGDLDYTERDYSNWGLWGPPPDDPFWTRPRVTDPPRHLHPDSQFEYVDPPPPLSDEEEAKVQAYWAKDAIRHGRPTIPPHTHRPPDTTRVAQLEKEPASSPPATTIRDPVPIPVTTTATQKSPTSRSQKGSPKPKPTKASKAVTPYSSLKAMYIGAIILLPFTTIIARLLILIFRKRALVLVGWVSPRCSIPSTSYTLYLSALS